MPSLSWAAETLKPIFQPTGSAPWRQDLAQAHEHRRSRIAAAHRYTAHGVITIFSASRRS